MRTWSRFVVLIGTMAVSHVANATHPDLIEISREGRAFTCHPKESIRICPEISLLQSVFQIALEQRACVKEVARAGNATGVKLKQCFLVPGLQHFFDQLQLADVPASCVEKRLGNCKEVRPCAQGSREMCGNLGGYIQLLKDHRISEPFTVEDGQAACASMIY